MHQLHTFFQQWFEQQQLPAELSIAALLLLVLLLGGLLDLLIRKVLLRWIHTNVHSNTMEWDDVLWKYKVFQRGVHLFPGILLYYTVSRFLSDTPLLQDFLIKLTTAYLVIMGGLAFLAIINAMTHLADLKNNNDKLPLRVLQQSFKLMVALAIVVTLFSLLLDQNPLYLLSGLGAFTAIILLIFKDTLLGLVAGVQLAANDMVRRKDWIEMSKYDADGDVVDVGLTTVKVRNWDKTITTIPTYALITDSFKNWRGMTESGGRRIKRSVLIDVTSIAFMTDELNAALAEVTILTPYLAAKNQQLAEQPEQLLKASLVNGRRLTNIGTFRAYLEYYLRHHPDIHQTMTLLVRQLAATEKGLPIEVYCFSAVQEWARYEAIQADIFDHVFAILPCFGLRAYQAPSGADFTHFASTKSIDPR